MHDTMDNACSNTPTLQEFIGAVYLDIEPHEVICLAKPVKKGFAHMPLTPRKIKQISRKADEYYICVSTVSTNEPLRRRRDDCLKAYVIMLDDIGTKARAPDVEPSCILETSEGNYQYLYFLQPYTFDTVDKIEHFEACNRAMVDAGYGDPGAQQVCRVFRTPGSINTKKGKDGWKTRVTHWNPDIGWSLDELMDDLGLEPVYKESSVTQSDYDATVPKDFIDPVLDWLCDQNMLGENKGDFFDVKCPWADNHTSGADTAGYSPLGYGRPSVMRGFHCFHAHCQDKSARDFLEFVQKKGGPGVTVSGAREISADQLKQETRDLSQAERIEVLYASFPTIYKASLPNVVYGSNGPALAQKPTRPNIQYILDQIGICTRLNIQTHKPEITFKDDGISVFANSEDETLRCILDTAQMCGITSNGAGSEVPKVIAEMAQNDTYHPMADWVTSKPWDGVNRFDDIANAVKLEDAEHLPMWRIYLRKWLIQCVQAVCGWQEPKQMRSCLVLSGEQLIGKSRFFGSLVPSQFFLEGAHLELQGGSAKDSIMQTTAYPIVELGELETTFSKSASGQLKAFLAMRKDFYRAPYDARAKEWPRCTSFCGTVNKTDFLVDDTGSSRFWPMRVVAVNPDHGIDMQQLWAEVHTWWISGEQWWLDDKEDKQRAILSEQFEVVTDVKELAAEWLDTHSEDTTTAMNVTAFAVLIGVQVTRPNLSLLRGILERKLGPAKRQLNRVQNAWAIPTGTKMS